MAKSPVNRPTEKAVHTELPKGPWTPPGTQHFPRPSNLKERQMTSKAATLPPPNSPRPVPPRVPGGVRFRPEQLAVGTGTSVPNPVDVVSSQIPFEEGRLDYQIEFTYPDSDDMFAIDPRDIEMVSSFGSKAVIHFKGQEVMVNETYENCRVRVREARVEIMEQRRIREINNQLPADRQIPTSSQWSF